MPIANKNYRWYLLGLSAATSTLVSAIPYSCMPVLFEEISKDLNLSLVQIGTVWGMASLAGVFVSLAAGVLGDRFGLKRVLGIACLLVGLTGALRGFSNTFFMLTAMVFLNGLVRAIIPVNVTKSIAVWFKGRSLGMANGVGAMGMGLGLMLGPLISATVMSPLLGGWRNVLFLYGGISAAMAVLWFVFGKDHTPDSNSNTNVPPKPIGPTLSMLLKNKTIWILGLILLFRMGGIMGMTGYLPKYLLDQGWPQASADATLSVFYAVSTLFVIPISTLSDRIGRRKIILLAGLVVMTTSLVLLPIIGGTSVWVFMVLSGIFMDSFMSIIVTTLLETDGVGTENAGVALGMVFTLAPIGSAISPPLGNSLAHINPDFPFLFWAVWSLIALVLMTFVKETGWKRTKLRKMTSGQPAPGNVEQG
jgi:MFS family permease